MRDDSIRECDELDLLLDDALATYSETEPSPRIEARILSSTTRLDNRRPSLRWLPWAIPALAALLLFAILRAHLTVAPHENSPVANGLPNPHPVQSSVAPTVASVEPLTSPHAAPPHPFRPARTTASEQPPLPRLEVFPTPTPLSPQEQILACLVNHAPKEITQSAASNQDQTVEPLWIAAIHIPPLNPPDNGGN